MPGRSPVDSSRVILETLSLNDHPPGLTRVMAAVGAAPSAEIPVLIWVGERPGPRLIVAAGVHGDEYEGPEALGDVIHDVRTDALHGTLLALPQCNPWAGSAGMRTTPPDIDGRDLARTFPGDAVGSPTQRLAAALLEFVLRVQPALFADLHSGGVRYQFLPVAGYRRGLGNAARSQSAARAFGLPNLWEMDDGPGTFNAEVARRGIPTMAVELTGAGGCLAEDVAAARDGILNLMRWLGMLRDRPAPEVTAAFRSVTRTPSPASGRLVTRRAVGDLVDRLDLLAQIRSPLGDLVGEVRAPHAGHVWVMRHLRTIGAGELVCGIARPT